MQCLCVTPVAGPGSNKHQRCRDCAQPHALTRSERAPYVVNLAYRWFCGLSIDDKVPDRSAFSDAGDEGSTMRPNARCAALPPALLHRLIILAGARTRIGRLGVPIALEKEAEAVVAPVVAARNPDIDSRPAHQEAAPGAGC